MPRALALPASVDAFRSSGRDAGPYWFGDDMGGTIDPSGSRPSRRDFLIRAAVALGAFTVGGTINALATVLARRSVDARSGDALGGERRPFRPKP